MQRAQILKLINEELRIPGRQRSKHNWLLDHGAVDPVTTKLMGLGERNIDWTPLYVCVEPDPSAEPLKHCDMLTLSRQARHTHFTYKAWSPAGQKH
ncbi:MULTISPECIES: hypothetical protein [Pseudomonas]|uniref:Uncharacterized protein n=2 Tax=Pseudomonas fragariae (ex Marin et al. 2024) TaxID=3080056 RepID=A0ABT3LEE4_9PSED|nr:MULTISPECIES: hypothetical protein [Pseudomonas]MCW6054842.1 hypothetical protein [Pseudomonas fragi]KTB80831.1 hypothetical protein AO069_09560 [Pseudomonas syringae pv. syringae PD2774]KTB81990.1 hypothetical protein AO072_16305 [Pseudomonas syringae ICMP 13102]KWS07592.1 hypothetical protein AL063_23215 [Pseudomonas syringae pv. syringae]KWS08996.1 hypothetical protein AL064_16300 [Pseudomonas syringae pv. syringae]